MMTIKKAVFPVAGLGTRFLPATKASPKEMLPIVDKPVIQYIIEEATEAGIKEIILITGQSKRAIEDHFDRNFELEYTLKKKKKFDTLKEIQKISNSAKFIYTRQPEPLGLGHAILCAKEIVNNEYFLACSGDELVDANPTRIQQMLAVFKKVGKTIISVKQMPKNRISNYGVVEIDKQIDDKLFKVKSLVEKPQIKNAPSNLAIAGSYILSPQIFEILEKTKPGSGGEIQVTDAINVLAQKDDVYVYQFDGDWYDIGDKLEFLKATVVYGLKHDSYQDAFRTFLKKIKI
jgi:UTP--glucose-1-phosphate uridylyltransferase